MVFLSDFGPETRIVSYIESELYPPIGVGSDSKMAIETVLESTTSHPLPSAKCQIHGSSAPAIIDIRKDKVGHSLLGDIRTGLRPADGGEKSLPTLLLYDEAGLRLFEDITYLEEYYLTEAEIEVLRMYAGRIAERIPDGSIVLELGSG